jgi:hypothetical protein
MPVHLKRAAHGVDHAAELDDRAIAGALDDVAVMDRDDGVDQVAVERPETGERSVLVGAGEPGIADNIRNQNRRELSRLAHCAASRNSLAAFLAAGRCWRSVEIAPDATEAARMPVEMRATAGIVAWTETLMVRPTTGQPHAFSRQPKERRLGINTYTHQQQPVFSSAPSRAPPGIASRR